MKTEEVRNDQVAKALLMPVAYKVILDRHEQEKRVRERNIEAGRDPAVNEELSPTSSPMKQHEAHSPGDDKTDHICQDSVSEAPSIADQFKEEHQLGLNLEDALKLRFFLKTKEPEYNRRGNHRRLCEMTGTIAERKQLARDHKPTPFSTIEYIPKKAIEERDKKRRAGNAMINEYAEDPNFGAVQMVLRWAEFTPLGQAAHGGSKKEEGLSEADVEKHVGGLTKGLFWGHEYLKESA
jgi:hypothetical protein